MAFGLLVLVGVLQYVVVRRMMVSNLWLQHSSTVLEEMTAFRGALAHATSAARTYVLTGNSRDLASYRSARAQVSPVVEQLRALTADNPTQRENVRSLSSLVTARLAAADELVAVRSLQGMQAANQLLLQEKTFTISQSILLVADQMENEERRLLDAREHTVKFEARAATLALLLGIVVAISLVVAAAVESRRAAQVRDRAQDDLRQAEERLRLMIDSMRDYAVVMLDPTGCVQTWNEGAESITGYGTQEVLGRHFSCFYPPEDLAEDKPGNLLSLASRAGQAADEGWHVRKDGSRFWADVLIAAVRDGSQELRGFSVVSRDVTERKRMFQELQRAKEAADAASRAKSEFLANMSHEIRTPMNGVLGMTELALDTELTPEQRDYIESARVSADALLTVINEVLDFSKIEAGKLDLDLIPFNLRDHLVQTLRPLDFQAQQAGLKVVSDTYPGVPEEVVTDPARLRQVIVNLVGNAIKFTEHGEIRIEVNVESREHDHAVLHFAVRDTGVGIPREKQQVIFEAFAQADGSTVRRYKGTGLGLTISSRLVQMMGGRIWVESAVGAGSCFHFTVRVGSTKRVTPAEPRERVRLKGISVLVVDDDRMSRHLLGDMMRKQEMNPMLVATGEEALAALRQAETAATPFDLLVMDANSGGMTGFELAEMIREEQAWNRTSIMMLTSAGQRGDGARCRELGIAAYLTKPVAPQEWFSAVAGVLAARKESTGEARLLTRHSLREQARRLRILVAEDHEVNQRLISRLIEKRGHTVLLANNGKEALDVLGHQPVDLVLLDVSMPVMDGLQAAAAIRAREKGSDTRIPVIAVTAHAMKGDREKFLAAGMDAYITKPIQPAELFEAIESLVSCAA